MNDFAAHGYDAFGVIGTTFRELDRKTLIFFARAAPMTPNARPGGGGLAQFSTIPARAAVPPPPPPWPRAAQSRPRVPCVVLHRPYVYRSSTGVKKSWAGRRQVPLAQTAAEHCAALMVTGTEADCEKSACCRWRVGSAESAGTALGTAAKGLAEIEAQNDAAVARPKHTKRRLNVAAAGTCVAKLGGMADGKVPCTARPRGHRAGGSSTLVLTI
jgi:hypothetical protein